MLEFAAHMPGWRQLSRADLRRHRCLRLNPLWWLCIFGCAACILLGHGFHGAFRQGGAVRSDEYEAGRHREGPAPPFFGALVRWLLPPQVERRARIWWVYCYSGGFVGTVLVDLVALMSALASEGSGEERHGLGTAWDAW